MKQIAILLLVVLYGIVFSQDFRLNFDFSNSIKDFNLSEVLPVNNPTYSSHTVITGKLLGYDDRPIALAHAHLIDENSDSLIYSTQCDSNGYFILPIEKFGFNELKFTGVNHKSLVTFLFLNNSSDTVILNVTLEPNVYHSENDSIFIIGNINNFDKKKLLKMESESGLFKYKFNFNSDTIIYQLVNVTDEQFDRKINGTESNYYTFDGHSDYYSVLIDSNSIKEITFQPSLLPTKEYSYSLNSTNSNIDSFLQDYIKIIKEKKEFYEEFQNFKESGFFTKLYWLIFNKVDRMIKNRLNELEERIENKKGKEINKLLQFEYLVYSAMPSSFYQKKINFSDTNLINKILSEIAPTSNFWFKRTDGYPDIAFAVSVLLTDNQSYFDSLINYNPIPSVREKNIKTALEWYANFEPNKEKKEFYYNKLISEFPSSISALIAERRYSPNRRVQSGKKCPNFSLVQYDDKNKKLSNDSLRGKYILIDFWATWCGPCIKEFDNLENMYEKYKNDNIQFISISFDTDLWKVENFRKSKYNLPWFNVVETEGFKSQLAKDFEVVAIPKIILIDTVGNIITSDSELRGENLNKILKKITVSR